MVSYRNRTVQALHKLHENRVTSIAANESFCVTASLDKYVRVCPLDFHSFYLHCLHEAEVTGIDLTKDGSKLLSCTKDGSIGILDMSKQIYEVVHRSHAAKINDGAVRF